MATNLIDGCMLARTENRTKKLKNNMASDPELNTKNRLGYRSMKSEPNKHAKVNATNSPVDENSANSLKKLCN